MTFQPAKILRNAVAGLLLVSAVPAMAQDFTESHLAAARDALSATQATDPYDLVLLNAAEALKTRLIASNLDLEAEITKIVDEQTFALVANRADLEKEAASIYAAAFTEEELTSIASFYNSEAGQKLLTNGPIAAREIAKSAAVWKNGIERDLLSNVSKELQSAGLRANTDAPAPSGDENKAQETQN
ncbi:DUF2059 domain-containing protein [Oricola sp.]|uniref:DUF2059 domain-containing protein n=1 Tax=Oricola sp. TaxID=1979950 RepID=UPI0025D42033|nr:DUF2059 domain-containing protein [Oricola sp.]MCI5077295.1 DUF2059 domain-containing protein [Oricola sp.]